MNTPRPPHRLAVCALAVGLALALPACSRNDAASFVESAKSYLAKSDPKAAIIELRNARQAEPENAEIRFLLGRALLDNGEPGPAETELRRALSLRYSADLVQPMLARAVLAQGDPRKVTSEFGTVTLTDAQPRADLAATLAVAWLAQGNRDEARKAADAAIAAVPTHPRALTVRAQLLGMAGEVDASMTTLDRALAATPHHPEATVLKAELLNGQGRRDDAVKLLSAAVAAKPDDVQVRAALVPLLIASGDLGRAEAEVAALKKTAPQDFRTVYVEALTALAKEDYAKARDLALPLIATRPDHAPSLYLSGAANFQLKSWAAAEDALRRVVAQVPGDRGANRLLVATYLRSGRNVQAAETAEAALRRVPDDPVLLRLAGEAQVLNGNAVGALRLFERAAELEKSGSVARVRLAQARLAQGDAARAMADLERISAAEPSAVNADLALYAAHIARREYDKALAVVATIEKKQPGAAASELRGNALLGKRDYAGARANFDKAFAAEPGRLSAARSLAALDLLDNKPADAKARYERMIAADPRSPELQIALAELLAVSGAPAADVRAALDRAVAANPSSPAARIALVGHLRRVGDLRGALEAARSAAAALPEDPQVIEALGTLQFANQEFGQARDTFVKLSELQPRNPNALLRVSEAYVAQKDYAAALDAQRKALAIQPDYPAALLALAGTYLIAGKPDAALAEAKRLQKERPGAALGWALESELFAAQKKYPEAAAAMREAVGKQSNPNLAARLYGLLTAAGKGADANVFADRWTKDHPKDAVFLTAIGQQRQAAKDKAGAVAYYRAALEVDPGNAVVLNNLAWLMNEQGKAEARELGERAYRLAPLNPSIVDTYGTILVAQGEKDRGLALLRMASNLAPNDPQLRINLARGLAKSGDKAGAKRELEAVLARDARPSPARAEAEAMLKTL
jgi:putative PEP-CTERM system TPR-repeat lipoprotein